MAKIGGVLSSLVTVIKLGCPSVAGVNCDSHISQSSTQSGLYAYEHLVHVHILGGVSGGTSSFGAFDIRPGCGVAVAL